jgi:hypothetical protein
MTSGGVLLNWLSRGRGPLLLSSRVRAGIWTPEPVNLPVKDALEMAKGKLSRARVAVRSCALTLDAGAGFDLVVVQRAEVPVCMIMNFTRRTCWL